jgi:Cu(I)/Ag(I) efflux system membrane fusion protein
MKNIWSAAALTALVLAACGKSGGDASPRAGMTAEEHAKMQAGGTEGAMDSAGAVVRQTVHLTAQQEQALGVTYVKVQREPLTRSIRTVGEILAPEQNVRDVTPKVAGYVERLDVNTTGESVRKGRPLLAIYSPDLVAAQEEFLTARRLATAVDSSAGEAWQAAQATLESARRRLAWWDVTPAQIARLERTGEVAKNITLVSPVGGIVLEKNVLEGQRVMPGDKLYRIADLSEVWVEGEMFEQDLKFVRPGTQAHIEVSAYPGEHVMGRVSFVYPTVDVHSRTNRVRITVPNRDLRLKPGMFATIYFDSDLSERYPSVPMAAVIATGERNLVFVRDSTGMLSPREVVLGARAEDRVQVLGGLSEGETIVGSANFLVDAESRLAATGSSMPGMQHMSPPKAAAPAEHKHD